MVHGLCEKTVDYIKNNIVDTITRQPPYTHDVVNTAFIFVEFYINQYVLQMPVMTRRCIFDIRELKKLTSGQILKKNEKENNG